MAVCQVCHQPIRESVIEGRKLIAQLHAGPHTAPDVGRYLTVLNVKCACGEWLERRYENLSPRELKPV